MLLVNASKYIEGSFEVWLLRRQSTSMSWIEVTARFIRNIYSSMVYITTYILNDYEHRYLPVCVCSLILTRSTGHATISWAAPPAEPARNICVYDPKFWVLAEDSIARRDVPYTPKNREFIAPADKIGYHIPLNSPRIYDDIHILYLSQRIHSTGRWNKYVLKKSPAYVPPHVEV